MDRLNEIQTRLAAIASELEGASGEVLTALESEVSQLTEERDAIMHDVQTRQQLREAVANGTVEATIIETKEERKMENTFTRDSREYRNAWLNTIRGVELSDVEQRAFAAAGSAIATETANDIMTAVKQRAPLLQKMTVIYSAVSLSYYVEGTVNAAGDHTENAAITAAADTLTKVSLVPGEIVKLIQISEAAKAMSVDAFEKWIVENLADAIAAKINAKIIAAITPSTASATTYTAATVQALLGAVKGNVSLICNRNTLFTNLLPLQDNAKNSLVSFAGGEASVYGCPVLIDDGMADNVTVAGDLSKAIAAMGEDVNVRNQYDIDTNSYKYLGVALFDVKVGIASAFAKIDSAS